MAKKIVMFGDSLTFGYGVNKKDSITSLISEKTCLTVINSGVNGDNTRNALRRIEKDVISHNGNIVTVLFGSNDSAPSEFYYVTPYEFEENINKIIEVIKKAQPSSQIILITPPPVDDTVFMPYTTNKRLGTYCDIIRKIANEQSLPLCDFNAYLTFASQGNIEKYLQDDGTHLSEEGYKCFEECLYDVIKNTYKNNH